MGHVITIGQTESGKSILNKKLSHWFRKNGIGVAVLDVMRDPGWAADFITDDPDDFLAFVKNPDLCLQCGLFIDEAGQALDRYADSFAWLTTQSRHHGHVCHLITQRAQQVSPTVRNQCSTLHAFNVNPRDAKIYAEDFNNPEILKAPNLPQGYCIKVQRFKPTQMLRMW
jgi:hypothetical protein